MAVLADQGYARIWATLDPANGAGGALYRALGFKATEKLPDHYGPGRDRMLLVARLEGADNG
jgi:ribosomal protein S18 acetylase RimI-like enzyme